MNNYASILQLDYESNNVDLNISYNTISNIMSTGFYSALFAKYFTNGNLVFNNNLVYNIGYLDLSGGE